MATDMFSRRPDPLVRGGYTARFAQSDADVMAAQRLRHACFFEMAGVPAQPGGVDRDRFDAACEHVLIEDAAGRLVCCYRVQVFQAPLALADSYAAQFYRMDGLHSFDGGFLELGRFCVLEGEGDADVLRLAWGMLARIVDVQGVQVLFGCSSFAGIAAEVYSEAFNLLAARHVSDRIGVKAAEVVAYAQTACPVGDRAVAMGQVPSLLRTYLSMGGWVSDHAVVDRDMNTLHVFTGLEIAAIPAARAKALRAVAAGV